MENEERIIALLEELVAWTRLSAREGLVPFLRGVLADPKHLKAYELSDGSRTQREVADAAGLSQSSVSVLYQKWRRLGIVRDANGRAVHFIRPSDLGLEATADTESKVPARRSRKPVSEVPDV